MEKETVNYHTEKSPAEARELLQVDPLQKGGQNDLSPHGLRDSAIFMESGKSFKNIKRNYEGWYTLVLLNACPNRGHVVHPFQRLAC